MHTVLILRGLPASGKTTWALSKCDGSWKRINRDELRQMFDGGVYSKEREILIREARNFLLILCLKSGYNVIIDDCNLRQEHIDEITDIVNDFCESYDTYIEVQTKVFNVDIEICIERDSQRKKPVGEKIIRRMSKDANLR